MKNFKAHSVKQARKIFLHVVKHQNRQVNSNIWAESQQTTMTNTKATDNQLTKAQQQWNAISRMPKREGANALTIANFYMAAVHAVLLYGADSWVITKKCGETEKLP